VISSRSSWRAPGQVLAGLVDVFSRVYGSHASMVAESIERCREPFVSERPALFDAAAPAGRAGIPQAGSRGAPASPRTLAIGLLKLVSMIDRHQGSPENLFTPRILGVMVEP
jgi:hypothetical protein